MNVFKKRYDPELGRYVNKNIYSGEKLEEGGRGEEAVFSKEAIKKASKTTASKVSKKEKKKAGDKITQLLKGNELRGLQQQSPQTDEKINERINKLMSRGKLRKK